MHIQSLISIDNRQLDKILEDFAWFLTRLFEDEDDAGYVEEENLYSEDQIRWAVKKFVGFYIDRHLFTDYSISKLTSRKNILDIELILMRHDKCITYSVTHQF